MRLTFEDLFEKYRIDYFFLLFVILTTPLPFVNLVSRAIIAYAVVALIQILKFKNYTTKDKKIIYLFILLYLIHCLPFLTSEDARSVAFDLEKKAAILGFPLTLGVIIPYIKKQFNTILLAFVLCITVLALLTYRDGFGFAWNNLDIQEKLIIHRPYFGMYCIFSFIICCYFLLSNSYSGFLQKIALAFLGVFNLIFPFLVLAKMAILSFALILPCLLGFYLLINKKIKVLIISGIIILSSVFYLGFKVPLIADGITTVLSGKTLSWEKYDSRLVNSLNLRVLKWNCATGILKKGNNWIYGEGTGDTQKYLDECYKETLGENHFFLDHIYNSHNMYLTIWLNTGITGLILLVTILGYGVLRSIKFKDYLGFTFILLIIFSGITESILEVQKGILFFGFFYSLFFINQKSSY